MMSMMKTCRGIPKDSRREAHLRAVDEAPEVHVGATKSLVRVGALTTSSVAYPVGGAVLGTLVGVLLVPTVIGVGIGAVGGAAIGYAISQSMAQ